MTIEEKLNSIRQTKEAIKTSIRNKGVDLEDTAPFNTYPSKIDEIETQAIIETENIEITPTKETQIVNRSENKYIANVKVNAIPEEYIIPSGKINIADNGNYNVREKEEVEVNLPLGEKVITANGKYNASEDDLKGYSSVEVEIKAGYTGHCDVEGLKAIGWTDEDISYFQENGVDWNEEDDEYYKLTPEELSKEEKNVSRFAWKNTAITNFSYWKNLIAIPKKENLTIEEKKFDGCYSLKTIPLLNVSSGLLRDSFNECYSLNSIPQLDTSNVSVFYETFKGCYSLNSIPQLDTSKASNMQYMFQNCYSLMIIPQLECGKVKYIRDFVVNTFSLKFMGGLKNIGKAYEEKSTNYIYYTINLSSSNALTHDSLMNVINNLYDLNLTYDVANGGTLYTQTLQLGSTNMAKLTEEEINVAVQKGWSVQ